MNWYNKTKQKEAGALQSFLGLTIPFIASLLFISVFDVENKIRANPQELKQQIEQKQIEQEQPEQPQFQTEPNIAPEVIPEEKALSINLDKVMQIESSGGKNNYNETSGARGPFQFMKKTWLDIISRMGKNWTWEDAWDLEKSREAADYYYNVRIPQMLRYYDIPDSIETRIASYDWGIGYLSNAWNKYKENWIEVSPTETKEYIQKYNNF